MKSAYTNEEIDRFLSFIGIPEEYYTANSPRRDLDFLTALHSHMLSTVPYENLSLHYSKEKSISLDPHVLYQKIILGGRGRGGYCMENSLLYMHMLRGLGFDTFTAGVRIRLREDGIPHGDYIGWVHIVNIVTLQDGSKWMVDVGFGGDGATKPIPLIEDRITHNIGTQDVRLTREFISGQTDRSSPDKRLWVYQYRNSLQKGWNSFYCFPELEFLPQDFYIMNTYTSGPESFQTSNILVVLFLKRQKDGGRNEVEIYGKRMMINGIVKENLGDKTRVIQQCLDEDERVEALSKWFGIFLTDQEREGIRGHITELKT